MLRSESTQCQPSPQSAVLITHRHRTTRPSPPLTVPPFQLSPAPTWRGWRAPPAAAPPPPPASRCPAPAGAGGGGWSDRAAREAGSVWGLACGGGVGWGCGHMPTSNAVTGLMHEPPPRHGTGTAFRLKQLLRPIPMPSKPWTPGPCSACCPALTLAPHLKKHRCLSGQGGREPATHVEERRQVRSHAVPHRRAAARAASDRMPLFSGGVHCGYLELFCEGLIVKVPAFN